AAGDLTFDQVALALAGAAGQQLPYGLLGNPVLRQRDAVVDAGLGDAAGRAVDLFARDGRVRLVGWRHDQRLLAGGTGRGPAGEFRLDLEFHAAVGAPEGDHGGLSRQVGRTITGQVSETDITDCSTGQHGCKNLAGRFLGCRIRARSVARDTDLPRSRFGL